MSDTTPDTANGTAAPAPAAPPELTAKEKRALREQVRRDFKAKEAERLGVEAAKKAPAKEAEPEKQDPARTDAERAADAAVFLRGVVWPLTALGAWLFGYDLGELTEAMAREDAAAWVPLARRYRWLDLLVTWASAPARLIRRVRDLARKRAAPEPPKEPAT